MFGAGPLITVALSIVIIRLVGEGTRSLDVEGWFPAFETAVIVRLLSAGVDFILFTAPEVPSLALLLSVECAVNLVGLFLATVFISGVKRRSFVGLVIVAAVLV